jgi:hypothetical protein
LKPSVSTADFPTDVMRHDSPEATLSGDLQIFGRKPSHSLHDAVQQLMLFAAAAISVTVCGTTIRNKLNVIHSFAELYFASVVSLNQITLLFAV